MGEHAYENDPAATEKTRRELLDDLYILLKPFMKLKKRTKPDTFYHFEENGIKMEIYLSMADMKKVCSELICTAVAKMNNVIHPMAFNEEWKWR